MDSQVFLENFGAIANAPGGVDRLRELVYDLAYGGGLATNSEGLSAREGWTVATLAELCDRVQDCEHRTPAYSPTGIPALRPRDVSGGRLNLAQAARVGADEYAIQIRRYEPVVGDIAYSRELSLGWAAEITDAPLCLSQGMVAITPGEHLNPRFLVSFLNGPARRRALELAVGSAHPHLNLKDIRQFEIPVPSSIEQERIVAKIDELIGLCDDLEARQRARHEISVRLRDSSLDALTAADADHLHTAWTRIHANWEVFADYPDSVNALRKTIFSLAIHGRLERQDKHDEPASRRLTRAVRSTTPDGSRDMPLPAGWERVGLLDVGTWASGSGFPKKFQGQLDLPYLFCKVSDMNLEGNERFIKATANTIDEATRDATKAKLHPAGTIIFPKIGGAIATNKRRILVRPTAIDNNCLGIVPKVDGVGDWLWLVLISIDLSAFQSGTSVPALSQGVLEQAIRFGLPPMAEQQRIIARVNELIRLCDGLVDATQSRIMSARQLAEAATTVAGA